MPKPTLPQSSAAPLLQLLVLIGVALAVPTVLVQKVRPELENAERQAEFKRNDPEAERQRLARSDPEWILVGNSMLNTRINPKELSRVSGLEAMKLAEGGSQSAIWFLFLKRIVLESGVKPKWITVFFRETDLTWPDFRIGGTNEELIKLLDGQKQPEWQQVIVNRGSAGGKAATGDVVGRVSEGLKAMLGGEDWRKWGRSRLQHASFEATEFGGGMAHDLRRREMNERFSLDHLRHDLGADTAMATGSVAGIAAADADGEGAGDVGRYGAGPAEFDGSPDASFLPHIIAVAKQTGARVHFHRVKLRRRAADGIGDSERMTAYLKALRGYLEKEGCAFTDESDDPLITADLYADGDHISREPALQQRYIEQFWKCVGPTIGKHADERQTSGNNR